MKAILDEVHKHDIAPDALPIIHISGCMSSCGTHQIGKIGFHGKVKLVDKKPVPGFTININGCDKQGMEHFGKEIGVMAANEPVSTAKARAVFKSFFLMIYPPIIFKFVINKNIIQIKV